MNYFDEITDKLTVKYWVLILLIPTFFSLSLADECSRLGVKKISAHRICISSMNNERETAELKRRYASYPDIEIIELVSPGESPKESIKKNLKELEACLG